MQASDTQSHAFILESARAAAPTNARYKVLTLLVVFTLSVKICLGRISKLSPSAPPATERSHSSTALQDCPEADLSSGPPTFTDSRAPASSMKRITVPPPSSDCFQALSSTEGLSTLRK